MTHPFSAVSCRRYISGILAVMIGLGPLATPAYAAVTALADEPLSVQNKAQPNIVLTVDDSTSMLFDFLPDNVIGKYCRDITGKMNAKCGFGGQNNDLTAGGRGKYVTPGYIYQQAGVPYSAYNSAFDNSGPGAGCDLPNRCSISNAVCSGSNPCGLGAGTCQLAATCSAGIDPGALPGLERYPNPPGPPPGKSPLAGQPYEYWTLWPAPVHNAELNHIYYNPRLTYDPPVDATGASYPQMNSLNTVGWTQVPADPWASTVKYVNLAAKVTVGLWCNSDWSVGHETEPAYCRTNGAGPTALTSTAATVDGDYNYPWAPPGIDPSNGVSTAQAIVRAKVDFGSNYATLPAWATAKDDKYYYENDNVLWCDTTSPQWPQQGPLQTQTCTDPGPTTQAQTCQGLQTQTCGGGAPQNCNGLSPQTCGGITSQTCLNVNPQTCIGTTAPSCPTQSQTCNNVGNQSCVAGNAQSCVGYSAQACGGVGAQSCVGVTSQSCNVTAGACNLPDPNSCPLVWTPAGCENLPPGQEDPTCHLEHNCPPGSCNNGNGGISCVDNSVCPAKGACSGDGLSCTNSPNSCALLAGHCSLDTGTSCFNAGACPSAGQCTGSGAVCHNQPGDCPATDGHCSITTGTACQNLPGQCNPVSQCSLTGNLCPPSGADTCAPQAGNCSFTTLACLDGSSCPPTGICGGTANQLCTDASSCPTIPGHCDVSGTSCTGAGNCNPAGRCSNTNAVCYTAGADPAYCPDLNGTCNLDGQSCNNSNQLCPVHAGNCSSSGTVCTAQNCPVFGATCSIVGNQCTGQSDCPDVNGTCNIDGQSCNNTNQLCPSHDTPGKCSIDHGTCSSNAQCPSIPTPSSAATCSDLLAATVTTTIAIANPGFEAPFVSDYANGPSGGAIAGASWTFTGAWTGIQHYGGSFGATNSGDGVQTATIVNDGAVSQTLTLTAGSYRVSFLAGRRLQNTPVGSVNPIQVLVDGASVGTPVVPTGDYQFTSFSREFNIASAGPHTITFAGTDNSTLYKTTFIDKVALIQGKSLLDDANSAGLVCRHNNNSGAYSSGRFDYPNNTYKTPVMGGTGTSACVASPRYALIPHHYWKTAVEWCDYAVGGAVGETPKWLGYGDRSNGTCQDDQDASHIYPRFYKFGQPAGTDNVATPAFQRIDMDVTNPSATFDHGLDPFGDPIQRNFGGATPDVSEMTNYANWFAYYRTRITAVKTVTSLAFKEIDGKYRVGFHTLVDTLSINPPKDIPPVFQNVAQFSGAQKTTWYSKMFGVTIPLGNETPTLEAMVRIGEYYKTGTHARLVGSSDPIILSCSKNFHILFTDGYTNEAGIPTDVALNPPDQDNTVPSYPYFATSPITGLTPTLAWPHPFQENTAAELTANSLSDYAMNYWVTDFQAARGNTVHNVLATDSDPATWQHQNFAAVSLGTTGKLPTAQQSVTEDQLTTGTLLWPRPYPNVYQPDNSGVDDLWHAAINGRGQFVNAQSVDEVKLGIGQVLADIAAQSGARAGAGLQSTSVGASTNFIYRARFEPGWAGSLTKEQIDPSTGAKIADVWKAATQLAAQVHVNNPGDTPWFTNRNIVTMDKSGNAVPFLWANLGAEQRDSLFPPNTLSKVAREKAIVEFLRGSAANEGTKLGQFRKRKSPLGDIADSSPVYVGVHPNSGYRDGDDPGYSTFKSMTRQARVYVGANDGMLHAFDDSNGNEAWAYVPSPLYRGGLESYRILDDPLAGDAKAGLGALAYQTGALPPFKHHYMVDGPLKVADVDFGGQNWRTILVGGMGKGGNRYFALDVTNPADVTNEATAASKVLWEFSDPRMGFTYGKPMIAKTRAFGGIWLVIVASGYNNPDGHGYLFFINAKDGSLVKSMTTSALDGGSAGTPSGLAHPAGYTQDFRNQLAEQIYAGDLLGDFWRFDVSDANDANWTVGRMARLLDPADNAQPVTTPPQIEVDITSGVDRWVFVGTGKLYDDSDLTDHQVQTMYALRDGNQTTPLPLLAFPGLTRHTAGVVGPLPHTAGTNFGLTTKPDKGWFDDLPGGAAGQRIVVAPQAAVNIVAYVGTSAQDDPCLTGQTANIYARDFGTGATVLFDGGGAPIESVASADGAVGLEIVGFDTAPGASQADIRLAITLGTTGEVIFVRTTPTPAALGHRMSWRLLGQ